MGGKGSNVKRREMLAKMIFQTACIILEILKWKVVKTFVPIARHVLAVPATSASTQRFFAASGSDRRICLIRQG